MIPITYTSLYTDAFGNEKIAIVNNHSKFHTIIRGTNFIGSEFTDLTPEDSNEKTIFEKFFFTKFPSNPKLCNCSFEIEIPINLIETGTQKLIYVNMKMLCKIGPESSKITNGLEYEIYEFSIRLNDKIYFASADDFEMAMQNLQQQWNTKYHFKNCFGCAYSDYSVYGQSAFGSMLCFVKHKNEYLKIENKADYIEKLEGKGQRVQEIFCCEKFNMRSGNLGYRG